MVSSDSVRREEILRFKLEKLEEKKNLYWRQRAKAHWLDKGDRSTRFSTNMPLSKSGVAELISW